MDKLRMFLFFSSFLRDIFVMFGCHGHQVLGRFLAFQDEILDPQDAPLR